MKNTKRSTFSFSFLTQHTFLFQIAWNMSQRNLGQLVTLQVNVLEFCAFINVCRILSHIADIQILTLHVLLMAGDHYAPGMFEACTVVSDDALFRDKLKHMGKCKTLPSSQRNHILKNTLQSNSNVTETSLPQQPGRNYLRSPKGFQKRQNAERPKEGLFWDINHILQKARLQLWTFLIWINMDWQKT